MDWDYSDAMIITGAIMQGRAGYQTYDFVGALLMGLGTNIQFEESRLSITRIVVLSVGGFLLGQQIFRKPDNKQNN